MCAGLKLGITYVNLDSTNPKRRIEKILLRCNAKAIFNPNNEKWNNQRFGIGTVDFNIHDKDYNQENIEPKLDGNTIAYIMFTSGSTGEPKGVSVSHQNLTYFIDWVKERYKLKEGDNFANISPMYFDNSVFDFYGGLCNGNSITPIHREILDKPLELVKYVEQKKCTIWFSVPSMLIYLINMRVLTKGSCETIRVFTFGGEGFPKSILKKLFKLFSNQAEIVNVYGPTEGTCICSSYDITESDFESLSELPSLGKINPNFSYQIIDANGNEAPQGELVILGPCISPGYYNDEEKSKKVFGEVDFGPLYLNRYYKTGDLVYEENGLLYFKGRADNQIKHMGYRIELEEIEMAINSLEGVKESAVVYKRINDSYGKLIGFIALSKSITEKDLKLRVKDNLPHYMVPSKFNFLDVLPKNANGKIDRKYLLNGE
jgi:D-alanine--poly(phosphoribitol) ligase subunit 1